MKAFIISLSIAIAITATLLSSLADANNLGLPKSRMQAANIHKVAIHNFTYAHDFGDTWDVYDASKPFMGDCEDFAFSMQRAVGAGHVYLVARRGVIDHAVYVYAGIVWENDGSVYSVPVYMLLGNTIMIGLGPVNVEEGY